MDKMNNHTISPSIKSYVFYTNLPPRNQLNACLCTLEEPPKGSFYNYLPNHWRAAKCRSLVRECSHFLAAPIGLGNNVTIVCSKAFAGFGSMHTILSKFGFGVAQQNVELKDHTFKAMLEFTMVARLSPKWSRVDSNLLVFGQDFLTLVTGIPAIKYSLNVVGTQAQILLQPLKVKLPMLQACDLEMNDAQAATDFFGQRLKQMHDNCIDLEWVYTLPSMKPARVMSISHYIPETSPMKTYPEIVQMWMEVFGYKLPYRPEEGPQISTFAGPYVNLTYDTAGKQMNSKVHTFPAICVRPYKTVYFRNVDQHLVLSVFISNLAKTCPLVCGFHLQWMSQQKLNLSVELKNQAESKMLCEKEIDEIVAAIKRDHAMSSNLSSPSPPPTLSQLVYNQSELEDQAAAAFNAQLQIDRTTPEPSTYSVPHVLTQDNNMYMEISSTQQPAMVPNMAVSNVNLPAVPALMPSYAPLTSNEREVFNGLVAAPVPASQNITQMVQTSSLFASGTGEVSSSRPRRKRAVARKSLASKERVDEARTLTLSIRNINMAEFVKCNRVARLNCKELKQWLVENKVPFHPRALKKDLVQTVCSSFNQPAQN